MKLSEDQEVDFGRLVVRLRDFDGNKGLNKRTFALRINSIPMDCPYCQARKAIMNELDKLLPQARERNRTTQLNGTQLNKNVNKGVVELYEAVGECPDCGKILGSIKTGKDSHKHDCVCGFETKKYDGPFVDDDFNKEE